MSLRSTIEYYKQAEYLYKSVDSLFQDFEDGKITSSKIDSVVNKGLNDINRLNNVLNKINIRDLIDHYEKDAIEDIEHNVDFMYEAADYVEKYLLGKKYYDSLLGSVENYFEKMGMFSAEYKRYAESEYEYAKKFTSTILHPNNINQFINQTKRIALGTMSMNEFKKIYKTIKSKMIKPKLKSFESFEEYKS